MVQGQGVGGVGWFEDNFVLAMNFGIFGYHGTILVLGSIHLGAEIPFRAESFGTVPKFWLRILAQKSFGMKFSCQNSVPKF